MRPRFLTNWIRDEPLGPVARLLPREPESGEEVMADVMCTVRIAGRGGPAHQETAQAVTPIGASPSAGGTLEPDAARRSAHTGGRFFPWWPPWERNRPWFVSPT